MSIFLLLRLSFLCTELPCVRYVFNPPSFLYRKGSPLGTDLKGRDNSGITSIYDLIGMISSKAGNT